MGCPRPDTPRSDPYDLGELDRELRDRLWTAIQHSPADGLTLVSGYRDPGRQWDLRNQRVPRGQECNPAYRGYPVTAVPYASKHQKRAAADMGGRDLPWLMANHRAFGLARTVPSENWHYEVAGTPAVQIIPYPFDAHDQAPTPPPPARPAGDLTMADAADILAQLKLIKTDVAAARRDAAAAKKMAREAKAYAKAKALVDLSDKDRVKLQALATKIDAEEKVLERRAQA